MNKIGFFEEAPGQKSITRLLVFIIVLYGVCASGSMLGAGLYKYISCGNQESLTGIATAVGGLLTAVCTFAAGWKLIQKPMENKTDAPAQ